MLSIRLTPEIEDRLNRMSLETGRSPAALALEAVLAHLDDLEDGALAESRVRKDRKAVALEDVAHELGMRGRV